MDLLNKFIINFATIIVFMTAVEIIAPDNSMKKYIKFVLGLILIAFMINPIVYFASNGETIITDSIEKISNEMLSEKDKNVIKDDNSKKIIEDNFKNKFQNNLNDKLHEKYPENTFESRIEGTTDFESMKYNLDKLYVYVDKSDNIKKVEKVVINDYDKQKNNSCENDNMLNEITDYICQNIHIDKDKIVVKYK